jgi:hypothetical protein
MPSTSGVSGAPVPLTNSNWSATSAVPTRTSRIERPWTGNADEDGPASIPVPGAPDAVGVTVLTELLGLGRRGPVTVTVARAAHEHQAQHRAPEGNPPLDRGSTRSPP